jgi:electron transfer flavoprotein beta subunit
MKIIVCVKQVLDPEIPPAKFKIDAEAKKVIPPPGVPPVISVFDERAVEAACRLKDKQGGTITVISLGPAKAADVVKHAIAMGADEGFVLQDEAFEDLDSFGIAYVLGKAIQKIGVYDLVLCGRQSADWGNGQVGSILAEILGIPVVTLACDIQAVDNKLKVKRIVKDGYELLEAPIPSLITVSSELGLPRLPAGMRIMIAARKQVPVWKAADIGAESSQLDKANAHSEVTGLSVPTRKTECEIIAGDSPSQAAENLASKLVKLL